MAKKNVNTSFSWIFEAELKFETKVYKIENFSLPNK